MSRVDSNIQEAFASGIQCVLSKDYAGLVSAFMSTGFVGSPLEWRAQEADPWQLTHPEVRGAPCQKKEGVTNNGLASHTLLHAEARSRAPLWAEQPPPKMRHQVTHCFLGSPLRYARTLFVCIFANLGL